MAESFIEEIYEYSMVIETAREVCQETRRMKIESASVKWNQITAGIEKLAGSIAAEEPSTAETIMNAAVSVRDAWADPALFSARIERELLPALMKGIRLYTDIDVTEGEFRLRSADTGFLSLMDQKHGIWLHDSHDPMWEAHELAEALYHTSMDEFHIFGGGLGYLAYQLWLRSCKTLHLYLYETDEDILTYAYHYGVLEWIDAKAVTVVKEVDPLVLKKRYEESIAKNGAGGFISIAMGEVYQPLDGGALKNLRLNDDASRWFHDLWELNYRKNRKCETTSVAELRNALAAKEWVVIAAGPSVNDRMAALKKNRGNFRIVAVDVILPKLLQEGLVPDIVVTADPKDQMERHIAGISEETAAIPLLASCIASWRYVSAWKGKVALMVPANSVRDFGVPQDASVIWDIGGTVSSLAIETAVRFGAEKVYLVGLDLSYPGGERFAGGTRHITADKADGGCFVESVDGGKVESSATFIYFIGQIEQQLSQYPRVKFWNLSRGGAKIKGAEKGDFAS